MLKYWYWSFKYMTKTNTSISHLQLHLKSIYNACIAIKCKINKKWMQNASIQCRINTMFTHIYITVSLFRLFAKSMQQCLYFCNQIIFLLLNYIECLEDCMLFLFSTISLAMNDSVVIYSISYWLTPRLTAFLLCALRNRMFL